MLTCVFPRGKCLGGLGNSFGLFNALLHWVLTTDQVAGPIELAFPKGLCHNFGRLFGSDQKLDLSSGTRTVLQCDKRKYVQPKELCGVSAFDWGIFGENETPAMETNDPRSSLWCNTISFTTEGEGGVLTDGKHGSRCTPEHMQFLNTRHQVTDTGSRPGVSESGFSESCDKILEVNLEEVLWHYNVSSTRYKLQSLYYDSFLKTYQSPKMMQMLPVSMLIFLPALNHWNAARPH